MSMLRIMAAFSMVTTATSTEESLLSSDTCSIALTCIWGASSSGRSGKGGGEGAAAAGLNVAGPPACLEECATVAARSAI